MISSQSFEWCPKLQKILTLDVRQYVGSIRRNLSQSCKSKRIKFCVVFIVVSTQVMCLYQMQIKVCIMFNGPSGLMSKVLVYRVSYKLVIQFVSYSK